MQFICVLKHFMTKQGTGMHMIMDYSALVVVVDCNYKLTRLSEVKYNHYYFVILEFCLLFYCLLEYVLRTSRTISLFIL